MLQHCVEDREQFSHARRERHLLRFSHATQPLIKGPDDGIKAGGDDRAHIENGAHLCPATPHRPSAAEGVGGKNGDILVFSPTHRKHDRRVHFVHKKRCQEPFADLME